MTDAERVLLVENGAPASIFARGAMSLPDDSGSVPTMRQNDMQANKLATENNVIGALTNRKEMEHSGEESEKWLLQPHNPEDKCSIDSSVDVWRISTRICDDPPSVKEATHPFDVSLELSAVRQKADDLSLNFECVVAEREPLAPGERTHPDHRVNSCVDECFIDSQNDLLVCTGALVPLSIKDFGSYTPRPLQSSDSQEKQCNTVMTDELDTEEYMEEHERAAPGHGSSTCLHDDPQAVNAYDKGAICYQDSGDATKESEKSMLPADTNIMMAASEVHLADAATNVSLRSPPTFVQEQDCMLSTEVDGVHTCVLPAGADKRHCESIVSSDADGTTVQRGDFGTSLSSESGLSVQRPSASHMFHFNGPPHCNKNTHFIRWLQCTGWIAPYYEQQSLSVPPSRHTKVSVVHSILEAWEGGFVDEASRSIVPGPIDVYADAYDDIVLGIRKVLDELYQKALLERTSMTYPVSTKMGGRLDQPVPVEPENDKRCFGAGLSRGSSLTDDTLRSMHPSTNDASNNVPSLVSFTTESASVALKYDKRASITAAAGLVINCEAYVSNPILRDRESELKGGSDCGDGMKTNKNYVGTEDRLTAYARVPPKSFTTYEEALQTNVPPKISEVTEPRFSLAAAAALPDDSIVSTLDPEENVDTLPILPEYGPNLIGPDMQEHEQTTNQIYRASLGDALQIASPTRLLPPLCLADNLMQVAASASQNFEPEISAPSGRFYYNFPRAGGPNTTLVNNRALNTWLVKGKFVEQYGSIVADNRHDGTRTRALADSIVDAWKGTFYDVKKGIETAQPLNKSSSVYDAAVLCVRTTLSRLRGAKTKAPAKKRRTTNAKTLTASVGSAPAPPRPNVDSALAKMSLLSGHSQELKTNASIVLDDNTQRTTRGAIRAVGGIWTESDDRNPCEIMIGPHFQCKLPLLCEKPYCLALVSGPCIWDPLRAERAMESGQDVDSFLQADNPFVQQVHRMEALHMSDYNVTDARKYLSIVEHTESTWNIPVQHMDEQDYEIFANLH